MVGLDVRVDDNYDGFHGIDISLLKLFFSIRRHGEEELLKFLGRMVPPAGIESRKHSGFRKAIVIAKWRKSWYHRLESFYKPRPFIRIFSKIV
jgi:hypothetical protein